MVAPADRREQAAQAEAIPAAQVQPRPTETAEGGGDRYQRLVPTRKKRGVLDLDDGRQSESQRHAGDGRGPECDWGRESDGP